MDIIIFLQSFSSPFWDTFFTIITHLGAQTLGIIFAATFYWCSDSNKGLRFFYGILFSFSLNNSIKGIFNSPRPIGVEGILSKEIETATGSSFPSGHSQSNATSFTLLMDEYRKPWVWIVGIIMMILVPLSRLYLGVHWPADVIFGTILGIVSVFISNLIYNYAVDNNLFLIVVSYVPFMILGLLFPSDDLFKSLGAFTAFTISFLIVKKNLIIQNAKSKKNKIIRFAIGLLGALLIYLFFETLKEALIISFLKYFAITIWALLLAPIIFNKIEK